MDNIRIKYNGNLKAVKYIMNGYDELCDYKIPMTIGKIYDTRILKISRTCVGEKIK
jgi:hypothetical protein